MDEKLITMLELSMTDWDEAVQALGTSDKVKLADSADHIATRLAMLSAYLTYRGAAGFGDHGHDDAVRQAERARKRVRKALGFSYP